MKEGLHIKIVWILQDYKTRAKKSSPDMFNFYVVLAGHDMVIDAGMANTCRRKFKSPWLQTKVQKMKDLPVHEKTVWTFQTKKK